MKMDLKKLYCLTKISVSVLSQNILGKKKTKISQFQTYKREKMRVKEELIMTIESCITVEIIFE